MMMAFKKDFSHQFFLLLPIISIPLCTSFQILSPPIQIHASSNTVKVVPSRNPSLSRVHSHFSYVDDSTLTPPTQQSLFIRHHRRRRSSSAIHANTLADSIEDSTTDTTDTTGTTSSTPFAPICECESLGGSIYRLKLDNEDDGFLTAMSVPTFAVHNDNDNTKISTSSNINNSSNNIQRLGLEGIIPGAFTLQNVLSKSQCEEIIHCCENQLTFQQFKAGKNNHGAIQIVVNEKVIQQLNPKICPFIDLNSINDLAKEMKSHSVTCSDNKQNDNDEFDCDEYAPIGLNRRWRIYKYQPGGEETFAPHIDAGFPPSTTSNDGSTLIWDATTSCNDNGDNANLYPKDTVSRLTVLIYLNDDFKGGQTNFYTPAFDINDDGNDNNDGNENINDQTTPQIIASIQPKAGSILLFPQAVGEDAVDYARKYWPLHEGSPVYNNNNNSSRPKYVIRSDILFTKVRSGITQDEKNDPLWKNDDYVRQTFMPSNLSTSSSSAVYNSLFLNHCQELYNPHMGVENVGPLLYSLVRFTKLKKMVEIGAGYTTLWLLQALKENDDEMKNIKELQDDGKCRLLDIPWTIPEIVNEYDNEDNDDDDNDDVSSLLCIDNCLHQRETATGAGAVARSLGLDNYLNFVKGDAFDMQFEEESIDLLWCDFGVGSKMKDFAKNAWKSIKPGGFLVCHSTLTNSRTRSWLEKIRSGQYNEEDTGIPANEAVELSLLEPHKRYQNSITILQRRKSSSGNDFEEPIYSEYA